MTIAITKSIAASSLMNQPGQSTPCGRYSPNLNISYWVAGNGQVPNLGSNATLWLTGYFDQAGYDANQQYMGRIQITIPAASAPSVLQTDATIGAYILTLPQFSGGSAAEVA